MAPSFNINGQRVTLTRNFDTSDTNYVLLQTKGDPLSKKQKFELKDLGIRIEEFVGDEAKQLYLCGFQPDSLQAVQKLPFVEFVGEYSPEFAVTKKTEQDAKGAACSVSVLLHHDIGEVSDEMAQKIAERAGIDVSDINIEDGTVQLKVDPAKLEDIAALDEVRVVHTNNDTTLFNNKARQILRLDPTGSDITAKWPSKEETENTYRGEGQIVCIADTGLDRGSQVDVHPAFAGRVRELYAWGRADQNLTDDPDGHGTHVCGSVIGDGEHSSQGAIQGSAPGAELLVQSLFSKFNPINNSARLDGLPQTNLAPLFQQAYDAGARVHSNSWGSALPMTGIQRPYDGRSESIDLFAWEHQEMTILFAAGNDGQDADLDRKMDGTINERSLGAEAASKNCITVGATENYRPDLVAGTGTRPYTYGGFWSTKFAVNPLRDDHMADNPNGLAAFSSRGPTAENRLKPDVVAPGTAILSARSRSKKYLANVSSVGNSGDDKYMYLAGTSMATPLVAGCCAVLRQALFAAGYEEQPGSPTGSLVKALLINGAVAVGGDYMPDSPGEGHNPHSGFGRVDITPSLPKLNDQTRGFGTGIASENDDAPFTSTVAIPAKDPAEQGSEKSSRWSLKVTLVYADQPGGRLQNDLNLVVSINDSERHGNQMGQTYSLGSPTGFDRNNNVEQVVWGDVEAGSTARITIKPYRFLAAHVPFAYAWRFYESG